MLYVVRRTQFFVRTIAQQPTDSGIKSCRNVKIVEEKNAIENELFVIISFQTCCMHTSMDDWCQFEGLKIHYFLWEGTFKLYETLYFAKMMCVSYSSYLKFTVAWVLACDFWAKNDNFEWVVNGTSIFWSPYKYQREIGKLVKTSNNIAKNQLNIYSIHCMCTLM